MSTAPVEPSLGAESFSCPHCGAFAQQSWFRGFLVNFTLRTEKPQIIEYSTVAHDRAEEIEDKVERRRMVEFYERLEKNFLTYISNAYDSSTSSALVNFCFSHCHSCGGFAIWVKDRFVYPEKESTFIAHDEMPDDVREDFKEAASIVDKSPRGAAALLRLAIQKLMPALGEKGKDLNEDIASLVKRGLEVDVQRALDVVRVIGNNAVHPGQIDLKDNQATAASLFGLVNLIVERRIATPKRIKEIFDGLPQGALEQIAKRDQ
jgi:Domain of unknown function (DUF4145)